MRVWYSRAVTTACERCTTPLSSKTDPCERCLEEGRQHHDPFLGRVLDGTYRVLRRISHGSQGAVHEVVRLADGARFALKSHRRSPFEHEAAVGRFLREARVMLRLRHPAIATVHDVGQLDDVGAYFVLDYLEGRSVRALLTAQELPTELALAIADDVAAALASAHAAGVVHRDLKPENVVVLARPDAAGPRAKLVDFGIARISEAISITSPTHVLGTPGYMAPEYVRDAYASPASDQYSLGVLLYEMLSGRLPHEGPSVGTMLVRQATRQPLDLRARLPELDPELASAVMRALARAPEDRFASMDELRACLRQIARRIGGIG